MTETLTAALHSASFASRDLQSALAHASAVEALILMPLVLDAAKLAQGISGLISAIGAGEAAS